jgi:ABC-type xylose transport system permease subunit
MISTDSPMLIKHSSNIERSSRNIKLLSLNSVTKSTTALVILLLLASALAVVMTPEFHARFVYAQVNNSNSTTQPGINATTIYDSKTMVLGGDINILSH